MKFKKSFISMLAIAAVVVACEKPAPTPDDPTQDPTENPGGEPEEEEPTITEDGTEAHPYLVKSLEDLQAVREKAAPGAETFFRLEADIDMTSVKNWIPVNCGDTETVGEGDAATSVTTFTRKINFDGNNKTISNFAPTTWYLEDGLTEAGYQSLFGVLYGTVKNLNVTGANLVDVKASAGILAGYAGTMQNDVVMAAVVSNVSVQGTITAVGDKVGGMAGVAYYATFENCNADVTITTSSTDCGGLIGKSVGDLVVTGCKVKADITSNVAAKNRVGGLIGWNSTAKTTITDAHVLEGSVLTDGSNRTDASNGNFGGLIGYGDTTGTEMTISKSSATITIANSNFGTYNGGFIGGFGYASVVTITDSWSTGEVVGHNYTGGFVGAVQNTLTLKRCWSSANVSTTAGKHVGGLVGTNTTNDIVIEDCYTTGNVDGYEQLVGGIIGRSAKGLTMKNCFATGRVQGEISGVAGLVGKIEAASTVENCIAWNSEIDCTRAGNAVWAPGAVTGTVTVASTLKNCYRRSDLVLKDISMTLVDHENIENDLPPLPAYTDSDNNQRAYHGKAAAAGKTLSAVAKDLGWDEKVWDLSKDVPTLK